MKSRIKITSADLIKEQSVPNKFKSMSDKKMINAFNRHISTVLTNAGKKLEGYKNAGNTFTDEFKELNTLAGALNIIPDNINSLNNKINAVREKLKNPTSVNDYFNKVAILEKIADLPTPKELEKAVKKQYEDSPYSKLPDMTLDDYKKALTLTDENIVSSHLSDGVMIYVYYDVNAHEVVETENEKEVSDYIKSLANMSDAEYRQVLYNKANIENDSAETLAKMLADEESEYKI